MSNQYVLGIFSSHEADENDQNIFLKLNDLKHFNFFLFGFYCFQLICFTGYSIFSLSIVIVGIILNYFFYVALTDDNINIDLDYSNTNLKLTNINYGVICLIVLNLIDIGLTLGFSWNTLKYLFTLNNPFENKFAYFSCYIMLFRFILSLILFFWTKTLIDETTNFNFITKPTETRY